MKRSSWKAALAAVAMAGLISASAWAQDEEPPTCEDACYEAEEQCYQSCEEADDMSGCEQACVAQTSACLEACTGED